MYAARIDSSPASAKAVLERSFIWCFPTTRTLHRNPRTFFRSSAYSYHRGRWCVGLGFQWSWDFRGWVCHVCVVHRLSPTGWSWNILVQIKSSWYFFGWESIDSLNCVRETGCMWWSVCTVCNNTTNDCLILKSEHWHCFIVLPRTATLL